MFEAFNSQPGHHQDVPEGFIPGQNLLAIDAGCGPGLPSCRIGQLMFTSFRIVQNIFWGVQIPWLSLEAIVLFLHFPSFSYILPLDAIKRPGLWLRGLSSRFSHVIGLDQSQKLLEKAWRRFTCCSATRVANCKFIKFNLNKCCVSPGFRRWFWNVGRQRINQNYYMTNNTTWSFDLRWIWANLA